MMKKQNVITSNLNQQHQGYLDLEIYDESRQNKVLVTALVDTGFSGFLALPLFLTSHLKLNQKNMKPVDLELAIGEAKALVSNYTIFVENKPFLVEIIWSDEVEEALIGSGFFAKFSKFLKLDYINKQIRVELLG